MCNTQSQKNNKTSLSLGDKLASSDRIDCACECHFALRFLSTAKHRCDVYKTFSCRLLIASGAGPAAAAATGVAPQQQRGACLRCCLLPATPCDCTGPGHTGTAMDLMLLPLLPQALRPCSQHSQANSCTCRCVIRSAALCCFLAKRCTRLTTTMPTTHMQLETICQTIIHRLQVHSAVGLRAAGFGGRCCSCVSVRFAGVQHSSAVVADSRSPAYQCNVVFETATVLAAAAAAGSRLQQQLALQFEVRAVEAPSTAPVLVLRATAPTTCPGRRTHHSAAHCCALPALMACLCACVCLGGGCVVCQLVVDAAAGIACRCGTGTG